MSMGEKSDTEEKNSRSQTDLCWGGDSASSQLEGRLAYEAFCHYVLLGKVAEEEEDLYANYAKLINGHQNRNL